MNAFKPPHPTPSPRLLISLWKSFFNNVYGEVLEQRIRKLIPETFGPIPGDQLLKSGLPLEQVEYLLTGWGGPRLDEALLNKMPNLKAVFHAGGTVKPLTTDAFFERDLLITSAADLNAIPVAETVHAMVILAMKNFWFLQRRAPTPGGWNHPVEVRGLYDSAVGIIGFGQTARLTVQRIRRSLPDCPIYVHDPYLEAEVFAEFDVAQSSVPEILEQCNVISIHAPESPETHHLVDAAFLEQMQPQSTLINSSRGSLIDEAALVRVLQKRTDLTAVLDVAEPEPPTADSPLYTLPNITITPHIYGSLGLECRQMGRRAVDELERHIAGRPPINPVMAEQLLKGA